MNMPDRERNETDWKRLDAMSDEEAEANARSDPDNPPMTAEQFATAKRRTRAEVAARAALPKRLPGQFT